MKKWIYIFGIVIVILTSCKDDDVAIFDKTPDERVSEAIATLKQDLTAPANGWKLKYRPESESGSFYVLLDFNEDNTVHIKSDLGNNDGQFFEQTVTYRIDSSLGLELIIETYTFFSFLFEQNNATFLAEYEFNFINKTPDEALVFNSKTDPDTPTVLLFEQASPDDVALLGTQLSTNLNIMSEDLKMVASSLKLTYQNRDLSLFFVLDNFRRVLTINSGARNTNPLVTQPLNFSTPYILKGDSIVLDDRFSATVLNNSITIKSIKLSTLTEGTLTACANPIVVHSLVGATSANDQVKLETTLRDPSGNSFAQASDFFNSPVEYIFNNGESAALEVRQNITGAQYMQLYYDYDIGSGTPFYGIGFYIQNVNGTVTFALRQFTPTLVANRLIFDFAPDISIFGEPNTDANIDNINIYLDAMTEGDNTYVFQVQDGVYEFFNPCTGWSFVFVASN
jgi:Domain of unknown function (DUF4302)